MMLLLPCAIIAGYYTSKTDSEPYVISAISSFGLLISAASNVSHYERFPAKPLSYIVTASVIAQLLTLYTDLGKSSMFDVYCSLLDSLVLFIGRRGFKTDMCKQKKCRCNCFKRLENVYLAYYFRERRSPFPPPRIHIHLIMRHIQKVRVLNFYIFEKKLLDIVGIYVIYFSAQFVFPFLCWL